MLYSVDSLAFCLVYLPSDVWLILNDASLAFNIIEFGTFIHLVFTDLFVLGVFTGLYQNKIDVHFKIVKVLPTKYGHSRHRYLHYVNPYCCYIMT